MARRGQNLSICEEYRQTNFLSKNLTWGNIDGESADGFFHIRMAHISTDFVHATPIFNKKAHGKEG